MNELLQPKQNVVAHLSKLVGIGSIVVIVIGLLKLRVPYESVAKPFLANTSNVKKLEDVTN